MQIFEDFHRHSKYFRQQAKESTSQKDKHINYYKKINDILSSCPPNYKEWLTDTFSIENDFNLPGRVNEIFKKFEVIFSSFLNINKSVEAELVKKIVATRNYLTHRSSESKKNTVFRLRDIILLTNLIEVMINCMILFEMGYSVETINDEIFCKECFYGLIQEVQNKTINWDDIE